MKQHQRAALISMIADRFNVPVSAVTGKNKLSARLKSRLNRQSRTDHGA